MLESLHVEDLDRLLNELEDAASSNMPYEQFLQAVVERLRFLLDAEGAAVFLPSKPDAWITLNQCGDISRDLFVADLSNISKSDVYLYLDDQRCLAVPIRKPRWEKGALAVAFHRNLAAAELTEAIKLCETFAEIVGIRQLSVLENQLETRLEGFQKSLSNLANSKTTSEAAYTFVNDLAKLAGADRVTLMGTPIGIVVSGVVKPESKSETVVAIKQLCREAISRKQPITGAPASNERQPDRRLSSEEKGEDKLLKGYICVPLSSLRQTDSFDCALLIEWESYSSYIEGCSLVSNFFPGMLGSWQVTNQLLSVPKFLRGIFSTARRSVALTSRSSALRWSIIAAAAVVISLALCLPTPLRIEAAGTLQPRQQREVFAELDGVVSSVLVKDGQRVKEGEILVEMRSPDLEMRIQEVLGDMRAIAKRRDGINLVVNQLAGDSSDFIKQSQLSSEIQELDTRLETLRQKERSLLLEKEKLEIVSPIDGTVATREIERYLGARPIRRGDSLMRIVRFDGPWHLELQISDRDSGYVKRKLFQSAATDSRVIPSDSDSSFDFVIASNPNDRYVADAYWIADSARNPDGDGVFLDLFASVDPDVVSGAHMGATVHAYFEVGDEPFWFVWTRPFIESIQRKLWF